MLGSRAYPTRSGKRHMLRRIMQIIKALALAGLLVVHGHANAISEGAPAPALDGRLFDGSRFSLADHAGKVVVLNFWASWCAPCREEMPALDAYYRRHRSEGLEMIAISMDNPKDEAKARELMRAFSFPAAFAREANIKGYGRISLLPMTFVIDRQGALRMDGRYRDSPLDMASLEKTVTPLLRARMNSALFVPTRTPPSGQWVCAAAPIAWTWTLISTTPAFSNVSFTEIWSPCFNGCFRSSSMT
jgi:cytochrome c biogenesis protein CcmG/thiol:disulfide interchange protein DsbE